MNQDKRTLLFLAMLFSLSMINGMKKKEAQDLIKIPLGLTVEKDKENSGLVVKDKFLYLDVNNKAPHLLETTSWKEQIEKMTSRGFPWVLALAKKENNNYCCYEGVNANSHWYGDIKKSETEPGYYYDNPNTEKCVDLCNGDKFTEVAYFTINKKKKFEMLCVNDDLKRRSVNSSFYCKYFYFLKKAADFITKYPEKYKFEDEKSNGIREEAGKRCREEADQLYRLGKLLDSAGNALVKGTEKKWGLRKKIRVFQERAEECYRTANKFNFEAITLFDVNVDKGAVCNAYALICYHQKKFNEAKEYFTNALNLLVDKRNKATACSNLASTCFSLKEYQEAKKFHLNARSLNPDYANSSLHQHNLGSVYEQLKQFKNAEACYLTSIKVGKGWKNKGHGYKSLVNLYEKWGKREKSFQCFLEGMNLLSLDYQIASFFSTISNLSRDDEEVDRVEQVYLEAIKLVDDVKNMENSKKKVKLYSKLGLLCKVAEHYDKAEELYLQAIKLPGNERKKAEVFRQLAWLYCANLNRLKEAKKCYLKALELFVKPFGKGRVCFSLSRLCDKLMQPQEAEKFKKEASKWIKLRKHED